MDKRTLKKYKVLEGFLIAFIILFVFFITLMHDHTLGIKEVKHNHKYGKVISSLNNIKEKDIRVADIALLAAHDSNTHNMKFNAPMDEAEKNTAVGKTSKIAKGFQYRFAVTQQSNLYDQFMQGVRVFHIKYTYYNNEWYGTHAKLCGKVDEYVKDIMRGLYENPGEFAIILLHPMYFGESSLGGFHNYLETVKYREKNIYDYINYGDVNVLNEDGATGKKIGELTYNQVTNDGSKSGIILMDRRESKLKIKYDTTGDKYEKKYFDIDANTDHVWHSRGNSKNIIKAINKNMDRIKENDINNKLRINQTQLSFSVKDPLSSIFKWSLNNMAKNHNPKILNNKNFDEWLKYMPIVKCDFVTSQNKGFNDKINKRIFDYNTKLLNAK